MEAKTLTDAEDRITERIAELKYLIDEMAGTKWDRIKWTGIISELECIRAYCRGYY